MNGAQPPGRPPIGMAESTSPFSVLAAGYGARLEATRKAIFAARADKAFRNQSSAGKAVGASAARWNNWEHEKALPDPYCMLALKVKHRITLDWIYAGDPAGLPAEIAQAMADQATQPDAPPELIKLRAWLTATAEPRNRGRLHES